MPAFENNGTLTHVQNNAEAEALLQKALKEYLHLKA